MQVHIWPIEKLIFYARDPRKNEGAVERMVASIRRQVGEPGDESPGILARERVYDPFLGSGTTLAAAELTGRVCYAIELDPKYVDVAVERWQSLSGKKAVLEGDGRTFDQVAIERATEVWDVAA